MWLRNVAFPLGALALLAAASSYADDVGGSAPVSFQVYENATIQKLMALDEIAPFEDLAPLWGHKSPSLQAKLDASVKQLGFEDEIRRKKLAIAFVDIGDIDNPRVAYLNGDQMMYAASLPKIAVLLGAFEKIAQGKMEFTPDNERALKRMIRDSSNSAATEMMHKVGKEYIARVLLSPRYRLYDPKRNGGLWVGKDFAKAGLWRRDPLHNLSHGATVMQVARFYYLLETGNLVTPEHSAMMKGILSGTNLDHKFVRVLKRINPAAMLFRKSGSWGTYHSDSVMVKRGERGYIAVALTNDPNGSVWLQQIIIALNDIIFRS